MNCIRCILALNQRANRLLKVEQLSMTLAMLTSWTLMASASS